MKLVYRKTGKKFEAEILKLEQKDFEIIRKSEQFEFDWSKEKNFDVFKIVKVKGDKGILGLISLIDIPKEYRIHINLIENAKKHKGENKEIDKIAGCLLAFAAQESFDKDYFGFTSLIPKTSLIGLYTSKYGFSQYGQQLAIEKMAAISLIQKYL